MSDEQTSATAATESTASTGDQGANAGNGTPAAWHSSMGFDTETVGWMENRGLTKMEQGEALKNAITGFRSAEKFLGVPKDQILRIPNFEKGEKAELDAFYDKLGRPADPKDYGIKAPDGQSSDFAEFMSSKFHEFGLSKSQGEKIASVYGEYGQKMEQMQAEQFKLQSVEQEQKLRGEWGQNYDTLLATAKHGAAELGVDPKTVEQLQKTMGYDGVMKFFASVGEKFGEDKFVSGGNQSGAMTPEGAQAKIAQLRMDKEWAGKYLAGNSDAKNEFDRLMKMAYPS